MPGRNREVLTGANEAAVPDFLEWTDLGEGTECLQAGSQRSGHAAPRRVSPAHKEQVRAALTRLSSKANHSPPSSPLLCVTHHEWGLQTSH